MSVATGSESIRKMPTGSSRRKARVPLHITRQPIIEDGPAMDLEEEGEENPAFFDTELPGTSSKVQCNGMGNDMGNPTAEVIKNDKEEPELPEGTVIVQPEAVIDDLEFEGPEFKARSRSRRGAHKDVISDIDRVHCTSCSKQVNHLDERSFKEHPALKVVICRKCFEYYKSGKFTQDEDGIDEQCRWCAEGGSLICCDFCSNAFCKKCIKRNLGRSTLSALLSEEDTKWHCYICDPAPLHTLQKMCKDIMQGLANSVEAAKSRHAHLRDGVGSMELSDSDGTHGLLHPSIRSLSVSLQIKPECPSLEITQEGLRVLRPQGGDRHGLKMALWLMRSLQQTSQKGQKAIKKQLAAMPATGKAWKASEDIVQSADQKWVVMKTGKLSSKKSLPQENAQTSPSSKTKNCPTNHLSNKVTVTEETHPSASDFKREIALESSTPKKDKPMDEENHGGDKNEKADWKSLELKDISKISMRTRPNKDKEPEENEPTFMKVDQGNDLEAVEGKNNEEPAVNEVLEHNKDTEKTKDTNGNTSKKEENDVADVEERSHYDVECEKALMEEISEMVSDQSEEPSTPKMQKPDRKHLTSITPLRIKLEKIPPSRLEQSTKERCKSPRRQKTTPRSSRSGSVKQESDVSEDNKDEPAARKPKEKPILKELFEKKSDSGDIESSDTSESELEDIDWKSAPRRSTRRQQKEGNNDQQMERKQVQNKKVNKEKEDKKKSSSKDSDLEVDCQKTTDCKKKVHEGPKGPGKDSSNLEDDDSDEIERLLSPRKSKHTSSRRSSRLKLMPKAATKSKAKTKNKVRDSDSSNFDSDLERKINNLTKAPKVTKKEQTDQEESMEEGSGPEASVKVELGSDAESSKEKAGKSTSTKSKKSKNNSGLEDETKTKKLKAKKSKKVEDSSDSTRESEDETSENDEGQVGDDVQVLGISAADGDVALGSDLENKLAEQKLMEEIEAELDKDDGTDDEEDDSSDDEDSDAGPKKKRKGKNTAKDDKDDDDEFKTSSNEEDEEDETEDEDNYTTDDEKPSKKKQGRCHRLMRVKLGESSSDNGMGSDVSGSDSKKRKKLQQGRKRIRDSRSTSDSESIQGKPKKGKKRGRHRRSSDSDSSSRGFQQERSYRRGKGKGKKRRRIKVAADSDSDSDSGTRKKKGSTSSDEEKDTPSKHGRKKIRKLISKDKLQEETVRAAKEERERRKRIAEKRKLVTVVSEEAAETMGTVDEVILEQDAKTKDVLLAVDESIAKQLKPHQVEGVQFMWDCTFESMEKLEEKGSGCILAHCMGLGKTLQVITYLHTVMTNEKISMKHALVVAPLNTVLNWVAEFEKWLGEDSCIEVFEITSYKNNWQRADALKYWHDNGGVMVMGYSMYRQLSMHKFVKNKKQRAIFTQALVDPGPEIVICDEGHMLKNDASAISKALNSIRTLRRVCLTGTPLQNNLVEYHCMVDFVKPNLLGTRKEFLNRFVNPITNGQCADSTPRDVKLMKRRAHVLHDLLSGCVQRKDYSALTKFLPPKHEYVISVRLSPVQIKLYELYLQFQSRNDSGQLTEGSSKGSGTGLFADYQQLMQIWTHPHVLKLSEIRQEKIQSRNYMHEMSDFVTSASEVSDSNDSIQQFVVEGSEPEEVMEDDDMPSTSTGNRGTRRTRAILQQQMMKQEKEMDQPQRKKPNKGSGESDSSMEIIKTWSTRSRCRDPDRENITRSPSPNQPTSKPKWFDEYLQEGDDTKIELSGKLVLLFEVLKHAESIGEKVLVFSQSLLSLDLIEDMLQSLEDKAQVEREEGSQDLSNQIGGIGSWVKGEDYFRMDGSTNAAFRKAWATTFNDMKNYRARLFLISTKAGSLGTNLIGANRVIIFDASWNPSHDIQSIFRVYRFGQTRAVYIYRFVAQGTMEEKIYERQVTKQSLSCRVVDEHQIERHFTSTDLSELYTFTPERLDDPNVPERETFVLPKDYVLAEMLKHKDKWIVKYHEHDSLLENIEEEELTEEERKNAWKEYEDEKEGRIRMAIDPRLLQRQNLNQQDLAQLQGMFIGSNAMQAALLSNQRQHYNIIPTSSMNPSSMMQQLALTAASTDNYQQFQQILYNQRMLQFRQQQQQAYQKQQQEQQQQQQQQQQQHQDMARMRSGLIMDDIIMQQLCKPTSTVASTSKYVLPTQTPSSMHEKLLQGLNSAATISADKPGQPVGGGNWGGAGGGKSGPGASTGSAK